MHVHSSLFSVLRTRPSPEPGSGFILLLCFHFLFSLIFGRAWKMSVVDKCDCQKVKLSNQSLAFTCGTTNWSRGWPCCFIFPIRPQDNPLFYLTCGWKCSQTPCMPFTVIGQTEMCIPSSLSGFWSTMYFWFAAGGRFDPAVNVVVEPNKFTHWMWRLHETW